MAQSDFDVLNQLDHIIVKQRMSSVLGKSRYKLKTRNDQVLFKIKQEGAFFSTTVKLNAFDSQKRNVFSYRRPATFRAAKLEVSVLGDVVGIVRQERTFMKPVFYINDAQDRQIFRLKGNIFARRFEIQTMDKLPVGYIQKSGKFMALDKYYIDFPPSLPVELKTVVIGACILIDLKYHENDASSD